MAAIPGLVEQLVPSPAVGPLRYGLFNVARGPLTLDGRGVASGIQYYVDHCGGANAYDTNGCDPNPVKEFVEGTDLASGDPFWVVAKKHCGLVGRSAEEMATAARQQLLSGEQTVVESVLWNGAGLATHEPTLTGSGATVVTPMDAGAGAAIAALENAAYAGGIGYRGVIHVNQQAYAALAYSGILHQEGNVWRTNLGTAVSFGAGYDITGPADAAPAAGFVWAFMTAEVSMYRSDIMVPDVRQTADRVNNQWEVVAERAYAVTYDCPMTYAVQVPVAAPATAAVPAVPVEAEALDAQPPAVTLDLS